MNSPRALMLSPCFESPTFGGIQLSGSLAWEAVRSASPDEAAQLVTYGRDCGCGRRHSKRQVIAQALRHGWSSDRFLIWHLGMTHVLPLLSMGRRRSAAVFLHGIEAWRKLSPATAFALRSATSIWTNSAYTWEKFVEWNPDFRKWNHTIIPLGSGYGPREPRLPDGVPTAVMIGRMERAEDYKGHRQVINAWPGVLSACPGARLIVIGGGNQRGEFQECVTAMGLDVSIKFLGAVSEDLKREAIARSRCLLMPSRGEGFGLVYLEAMCAARPCLVSRFDAGQEVVQPPEGGLAVDPDNQEQLTQAITQLLRPGPAWEQMSAFAENRYRSQFTAAQFQHRILDALKEL